MQSVSKAMAYFDRLGWTAGRLFLYFAGCLLFSVGAKFFIDSHLGTDPLDVLCIGMTLHLPISIGIASGLLAIFFLSIWTAWNRRFPPLTPFFTTFSVGCLIDLWNWLHVENFTSAVLGPYAMLAAGLVLCSYSSALIIMSGIGIRIMDLVAITMVRRLGWSFFSAKMSLEVFMFATGWALGGPMGVGTIGFLCLVGPMIQPFMWANNQFLAIPNHGLQAAPEQELAPAT